MLDGLRSVDPELTKMMRSLGAGRIQRLWRVELPASLPYAFSGARVAITVSVIGAVFAEYVGSSEGLGHLINQAQAQLLTARSFAAVVVLSAIAIVLFAFVSLIERKIVTWDNRGVTRT
jgi:putative hydroxymethylpyrimidine transport system permease protein